MLDEISKELVTEAVSQISKEKARRAPIHTVHRWWSRRFTSVYRLILGAYLFNDEEGVRKAMEYPKLMREKALGKVFFEPFAGGGTGLVEAALAGFDVYGLDVNPVAVIAAKASLLIVTRGISSNFKNTCEEVLAETWRRVSDLWEFNGKLVTYIFISRGRVPTWLSTKKKVKIAFCPYCFRTFRVEATSKVVCPFCVREFEISSKPIAELPPNAPRITADWRAFAVELRFKTGRNWNREYLSVAESKDLVTWLENSASKAFRFSKELTNALGELDEVFEISKLRRANIRRAFDIFAPHQLASFIAYAEAVKSIARNEKERFLLVVAASEAAKCCSLLAKWYPPLGEGIPAGAVKALWVPEYTVITNPLASDGMKPLARGTLASTLGAQLKAYLYVEKMGGTSNTFSEVLVGDAQEAAFPQTADLVVLDPPYGKVKSYASLSLPHFYYLKAFGDLIDLKLTQSLRYIEEKEISPGRVGFQEKWEKVVEKVARIMHSKSRLILMFNTLTIGSWIAILKPFRANNLYPIATYWVLGEPPSGITTSRLRGMHLIVFRKSKEPTRVHVVWDAPIAMAGRVVRLNENLERRACQSLLEALKEVFRST